MCYRVTLADIPSPAKGFHVLSPTFSSLCKPAISAYVFSDPPLLTLGPLSFAPPPALPSSLLPWILPDAFGCTLPHIYSKTISSVTHWSRHSLISFTSEHQQERPGLPGSRGIKGQILCPQRLSQRCQMEKAFPKAFSTVGPVYCYCWRPCRDFEG